MVLHTLYNLYSSKPVAKKKEYIVPLIRKVVWRGVGDGGKGGGEGGVGTSTEGPVKSDIELALDREAAEAIVTGAIIYIQWNLVNSNSGCR